MSTLYEVGYLQGMTDAYGKVNYFIRYGMDTERLNRWMAYQLGYITKEQY